MTHAIEFTDDANPNSQLLIPKGPLDFIYACPRPGLEALGITINDRDGDSYTLLLTPEQCTWLIQNLVIGLTSLDSMRLEALFRHDDRSAQ
ncbi:hypothetical protein [Mycolicibacterium fortuitum]|uniref:hypothetical protein n=1 Tax=Mycolicibacterium fortuitum TaxID=1766 RepID=UPI00096FDE54|nr:hypothetical protein [Mycolicibacterium fortuitum]OMC10103.1 hypothetical protein A5734_26275 [Mycolicibacterium fortuitum]